MIQYLPPAIMFLITVVFAALFVLPTKVWSPANGAVRFYWRGVWMFLVAITSAAGAMNTLVLLGYDVVEFVEMVLNILLALFVGFVVIGWFHMVGLGALKSLAMIFRRDRTTDDATA